MGLILIIILIGVGALAMIILGLPFALLNSILVAHFRPGFDASVYTEISWRIFLCGALMVVVMGVAYILGGLSKRMCGAFLASALFTGLSDFALDNELSGTAMCWIALVIGIIGFVVFCFLPGGWDYDNWIVQIIVTALPAWFFAFEAFYIPLGWLRWYTSSTDEMVSWGGEALEFAKSSVIYATIALGAAIVIEVLMNIDLPFRRKNVEPGMAQAPTVVDFSKDNARVSMDGFSTELRFTDGSEKSASENKSEA